MKTQRKLQMTLLDLVEAVAQYSRNDRELALVVADLINRKQVKFCGRHAHQRVRVY